MKRRTFLTSVLGAPALPNLLQQQEPQKLKMGLWNADLTMKITATGVVESFTITLSPSIDLPDHDFTVEQALHAAKLVDDHPEPLIDYEPVRTKETSPGGVMGRKLEVVKIVTRKYGIRIGSDNFVFQLDGQMVLGAGIDVASVLIGNRSWTIKLAPNTVGQLLPINEITTTRRR